MKRYITIEKFVGETPLQALHRARTVHTIPESVPLAYAGRLDPMASGKLLILVGDECKVQEKYHAFDKEYEVEILLGVSSDSGDVLGLLTLGKKISTSTVLVQKLCEALRGPISLPYPQFSSKTVAGKPLHTWTLEKRLSEITIPIKDSRIHSLKLRNIRTLSRDDIMKTVRAKIETIPRVTDARKELGQDFRRSEVRASWDMFKDTGADTYQILSISCIASSGTYMRSLSELIGEKLGTSGLAYSIHRKNIGTYVPIYKNIGFWTRRF